MFISDKFLEILKSDPKELEREVRYEIGYYSTLNYNLIRMKWVSGATTITIVMRDDTVYCDGVKTLSFRSLHLAKKKYYGLYTAKTKIDRIDLMEDDRQKIIDAAGTHYFNTKDGQWEEIPIGPSVDDYL